MRAPLIVLAVLAVVSCTSADVTRLGHRREPRPENAWVDVYLGGGAPHDVQDLVDQVGTPPGVAIARLDVTGPPGTVWRDLLARAKAEARELGGEAIEITGGDNTYKSLHVVVYAPAE